MIAACHILTGAVIAEKMNNPLLGLFFAFLSHYALDIIPHREYVSGVKTAGKKPFSYLVMIFSDIALGTIIVLLFSENKLWAVAAGLVGFLPDADYFFHTVPALSRKRFFMAEANFHSKIIHFLAAKKISLFWRISSQIAVGLIAFYLLLQE